MSELVDIKGYEGLYQVSKEGKVYSIKSGRYLTGSVDMDGYGSVGLRKNGRTKRVKTHRLVASTFIPNPENKPQVNHKDEDKNNNHYSNLEWSTQSENILHRFDKGCPKERKVIKEGIWKTPAGDFKSSVVAAKANGLPDDKAVTRKCRSTSDKFKDWELIL